MFTGAGGKLFVSSELDAKREEKCPCGEAMLYIRELIWGAWALLGVAGTAGFGWVFFFLIWGTRMVQGLGSIRGKLSRGSFFLPFFFGCRGRNENRGKARLGEK
ncbi:hypothetical protein K456DRAFT_71350 [Colletotrichum gloeosporioides 23]|nr:hypothetical protein K456DRAFT_71350 [Colletotrichum gloeosporioides 23]